MQNQLYDRVHLTLPSALDHGIGMSDSTNHKLGASHIQAADEEDSLQLLALLQFVSSSVHELLDAADFETGINAWLKAMALRTGAARATFYENAAHANGKTLAVLAEWTLPDLNVVTSGSFAAPYCIDPNGAEELFGLLHQGRHAEFHVSNTLGFVRDILVAQGNASVLTMPIMVKGASWGAIGFDFLSHQNFTPRFIAILQTAADTLASVINRNQVQTARVAEQKARADENAALAKLLESVALASRKLIAESDFETGVMAYLQIVGTALKAARACFYDHRWHEEAQRMTVAGLCEWVQPGIENNIAQSFAHPFVFDPRGVEQFFDQMANGDLIVAHIEETEGATREMMQAQGNATVICVPVFVGDKVKYSIGFDSLTHRELDSQTRRVLEMAADAMAAAVKRWEIENQLREAEAARLQEQRERAQFAERQGELLAAVVSASELLLKAQNLKDVAQEVIAKIGQALAASRCVIGLYLAPDVNDAYGYIDFEYEWVNTGIARQTDQPGLKVFGLSTYVDFLEPLLRGEAVALITDDIENNEARIEQEQTGTQSQFMYPIMVDGKLWGVLGPDDCHHPRVWSPTEIDSLRLVASALGSVIKRGQLMEARIEAERQRESARRASQIAVVGERNRIAREIHDTLAQGFTGVIMQSQAAEDAMQKSDFVAAAYHLNRARGIAQTNLHDARRSVFALRPAVLIDRTLGQALHAQMDQLLIDSPLLKIFDEKGNAVTPSNLVATEILRIAQEAITNVLRHASAKNIHLQLQWSEDLLTLIISDDGLGFDIHQDHPGFGLVSMRERTHRMDAVFHIESNGMGTVISVRVNPNAGGLFVSTSASLDTYHE
jgi:signal transduction histidine kinase